MLFACRTALLGCVHDHEFFLDIKQAIADNSNWNIMTHQQHADNSKNKYNPTLQLSLKLLETCQPYID